MIDKIESFFEWLMDQPDQRGTLGALMTFSFLLAVAALAVFFVVGFFVLTSMLIGPLGLLLMIGLLVTVIPGFAIWVYIKDTKTDED